MIYFASFFILSNGMNGFDGFFFILMVVGVIIISVLKNENPEIKSPFAFNLYTRLSEDTLLYVYVCLSAQMIKNDLRDAREKIAYMSKYFKIHFPNEHRNFSEILGEAYREDIDYNGLVAWIKAKIPTHKDRVQIIYFLIGIGFIDGAINDKELRLLNNLAMQLGLSPKEFESMLGIHQTYEEKSYKAKQKVEAPVVSKLKLSTQILGVSEHASMDEIKKAYRMLVKKHHPDRFFNASPEQQKIAQERFMHIQKAYELLEILKKTN